MKRSNIINFFAIAMLAMACSKSTETPLVEPPKEKVVNQIGDTLTLRGTSFSPVPSENIVRFSGVEAKVLAATTTSLTTVVPANTGDGLVTVTTGNQTVQVANLEVKPTRLFMYKRDYTDPMNYKRSLIVVDPADMSTKHTMDINIELFDYDHQVYNEQTGTVMALIDNRMLMSMDDTTGEKYIIELATASTNASYKELAIVSGDAYIVKYSFSNYEGGPQSTEIVRINKGDNLQTKIATVSESNVYPKYMKYYVGTNELVGISENDLIRINIGTGAVSTVNLSQSFDEDYRGLIVIGDALFVYKRNYATATTVHTIEQIDIANGQVLSSSPINIPDDYLRGLTYYPPTNEIIGVVGQSLLFRFNTSTKANSLTQLPGATMSMDFSRIIVD